MRAPSPASVVGVASIEAMNAFLRSFLPLWALMVLTVGLHAAPLRVFIRGGVKTHGPNQHDHPRFLGEWAKLLTERGVTASGSMEFPTAAQLEATDVLVIYAADGMKITGDERARFEQFLARGGGVVVLHDGVVSGDQHAWCKKIIGGAWRWDGDKKTQWHEGNVGVYFVNPEHPIVKGVSNFDWKDEVYNRLDMAEDVNVLAKPTLEVLKAVHERNYISESDLVQLRDAYLYLRKLEHRLQYWEDAQTHHLPGDDSSQKRIALSMGHQTLDEFRKALSSHRANVANLFENAFVLKQQGVEAESSNETSTIWSPSTDYVELSERWAAWAGSARQRSLSDTARRRFIQLMAQSAEHVRLQGWALEQADRVMVRMMNLLDSISRRASYLALLIEYPHILGRLIDLMAASKWGADYLIKHPHLLDDLLNGFGQYSPEDHPNVYWTKLRSQINVLLDDAAEHGDQAELAMDILRQTHHTETFLTLLAELGIGRDKPLPIEKVSDRLSALADLILGITLERVWPIVANKYGLNPNTPPAFAVIAYGKLGGKELGYASDLDIVFLYDAPDSDQGASERYAMFARRLIAWLTASTSAGVLFEIDTRLRPNGAAGLLVTSIDAFKRYQLREGDNSAWLWEHQALTRARFCAGDVMIGKKFEEIRSEVLAQARDERLLKQEILSMRKKVSDGHPNDSGMFDIKHDSGGMVDIEFIVQYLVLRFSAEHPKLLGNWGNIALLGYAAEEKLISEELSKSVANAYRLYREYQHRIRLDGADKTRIHPELMDSSLQDARLAVTTLWQKVLLT